MASAMEILRNRGWLASVPDDFAAAVLSRCDVITLQRGQSFYIAGDPAGGICGVAAGAIEVHLPATDGAPTLTHLCGVGTWFGEIAAVGDGDRKVSIMSACKTRLLRLPRADIQRITKQDPAAWQHFAKLLAINFSTALATIMALRSGNALKCVAATLANLVAADPEPQTSIRLSQSDLAAITGLSRSTVSIMLSEMEKQHIIQRHYGKIAILSRDALRAMR